MKAAFGFLLSVFHMSYNPVDSDVGKPNSNGGAIQLDSGNIDSTLAENSFVFINFYADWCRFSNMLAPIWDEAADKINEKFSGSPIQVAVGKVDCDSQGELGTKFHITKYPTIKYVLNGVVGKREYRGQRSAESLLEFVEQQTKDPIQEFNDTAQLEGLDNKKRHLIGYFKERSSLDVANFRKIALNLKDDCEFHAGYAEVVEPLGPQALVVFRSSKAMTTEDGEAYNGAMYNYEEFSTWAMERCIPLVREITFENAEELTEEGLPFLILFRAPDDAESVKRFNDFVKSQLREERKNVNFLVADGIQFAHPLHHLGKSKEDLPLIAIDSFRHMYVFPEFDHIDVPGKLMQFLQDLYSGKLHREFHYGPDEPSDENTDPTKQSPSPTKASPPESQFQHLGPSKNRYTLLHDEF